MAASQKDCSEFTTRSLPARRRRQLLVTRAGRRPLVLAAQEVPQARVLRLELAQRARLDLAHALAGDADLDADLLQRGGLAVIQPEAGFEHVARALVQLLQSRLQLQLALVADEQRLGLARV